MAFDSAPADAFRYDGFDVDPAAGVLTCRYSIGKRHFTEKLTFGPGGDWSTEAAGTAAILAFLLAGVSYYKTSAPRTIDLGALETTNEEKRILRTYFYEGLGEFAYRNQLDLSDIEVVGPTRQQRVPDGYTPAGDRPLVPFGGGIDSIVTTETVRRRHPDTTLFIVSSHGDRFDAIERPAEATGLPIVRAERELDPAVMFSNDLGYLNGHVPVTGIISAMAVLTAVLRGHDAVVMSNEWSASVGNLIIDGRMVNHQWSKSLAFERSFRTVLANALDPNFQYFSLLRPYSELWVARRFAALRKYHPLFRSCNRAFHIEKSKRLDHWCGTCDKCCFIDLILSPFLEPSELNAIFAGHEPLADPGLEDKFRTLLGNWPENKPFECVGDVDECRAALRLGAARPGRGDTVVLQKLVAEMGIDPISPESLFRPMGEHCIPDAYTPDEQLV